MTPARLFRRAGPVAGVDNDALFFTPSRLGIIFIIAGLNSLVWVSAMALVSVAAGIEPNTGLLAGLGLVIIVLSIVGLAMTTVDRQ